jgi:hypothetical protein
MLRLDEFRKKQEISMKTKLFAVSVVLLGTPVFAQQIYVNSSPTANFSQYHTYAWGQGANPNQIQSSFLAQEAKSQVDAQLQGKGMQLVTESQNPDLVVIGSGGLKQQTSYNAWGTGGMRFGGGMATVTPQTNVVGTLIIDIYDAKQKQLVWRGMASDTLNETNSEKNNKLVDKAVQKMFKKYP